MANDNVCYNIPFDTWIMNAAYYIYLILVEKGLGEMTLDELNEHEDDIDEEEERIFEQYR